MECISKIARVKDLVLMFCLDETMDQSDVANSVSWYGYVLRREDGHVLNRSLHFEAKGQKKIGRHKRKWK